MAIKNLKTVYYKKETAFAEAYVHGAIGFIEIKVSELATNRVSEKLETKFLNSTRELNSTTSTGRVNGKMTFSKPLDASFYKDHSDLTESSFGTIEQAYAAGEVISAITSSVITVADGAAYAVGDKIAVGTAGSNDYTAVNEVASIATNDLTMVYAISTDDIAKVITGTDTAIKVPVFSPAETSDDYFTFVCVYDDDSVEVLSGAKAAMSFDVVREGKLDMKIEVMSAAIGSADSSGTVYVKPSGTITDEGDYDSVYVDFGLTYIYDVTTADKKSLCPYTFGLKVGHTVTPEKSLCGVNGINGYYSKADITAEIEYSRTPANLVTFASINEANANNFLWLSQGNFALIAEKARFTNLDLGYTDDFDNIKLNVDVNFSTTEKFLIALPH